MGELTEREREFLRFLQNAGGFATRGDIGCVTSRAEAKARQSCRKRGLAKFGHSNAMQAEGWHITPAGRTALGGG